MDLKEHDFEELSDKEQTEIIRNAPFSEKAELITRSNNPRESMENLALEEFVLMYNQSAVELKEEIVKYADQNQLVFGADIECWERDVISKDGLIAWLDVLRNAGTNVLYKWVEHSDYEFICGALMPYVEIFKTEHLEVADDVIGDRPFFTLDQLYYICIDSEEFDVVRDLIETLFENSKQMYLQIMEGLIAENEYEVVEEAYQLRNDRMSQIGFPEKDEAMRIYKPLDQWVDLEKRQIKNDYDDSFYLAWNLPSLNLKQDFFIDTVMEFFRENSELSERFYEELVGIANKIVVIEDIDFKNEHQIRWCANRAKSITSIGLEELSRGEIPLACQLLKDHFLENFFRYGMRILHQLKNSASQVITRYGSDQRKEFIEFLGSPMQEVIKGLLKPLPVKYKQETDGINQDFTDFKSLAEVLEYRTQMESLDKIFELIEDSLGQDWKKVLATRSLKLNVRERITLTPLINTLFLRHALNGDLQFEPFQSTDIPSIVTNIFHGTRLPRKLSDECKNSFFKTFSLSAIQGAVIFGPYLNQLEEEFGYLNLNYAIDPQFLESLFLITGE